MIGLDSRPRQRGKQVLTQQVSGTLILLHLDNGEYYKLDEVGSRVWELCDGTRTVADAVSVICEEYEASAETVEADVLALVRELADEKMVDEGN